VWEDWFAGFSDGESTFHIESNGQPRFQIALRDDDRDVLEECRTRLGGKVRTYNRPNGNSYAIWVLAGDECLAVVDVLERRMRSKKAAECTIWCEAVRSRAALPRMGRQRKPLMLEYKTKLEKQRKLYKEKRV
jgi:hypothetical protein